MPNTVKNDPLAHQRLTDTSQILKILLSNPLIPMPLKDLSGIIDAPPTARDIQFCLLIPGCTGEQTRIHPLFLYEPRAKIDRLLLTVSIDECLFRVVRCEGFEQKGDRRGVRCDRA